MEWVQSLGAGTKKGGKMLNDEIKRQIDLTDRGMGYILAKINTETGEYEAHHKALFELRENFKEISVKLIKGEKL